MLLPLTTASTLALPQNPLQQHPTNPRPPFRHRSRRRRDSQHRPPRSKPVETTSAVSKRPPAKTTPVKTSRLRSHIPIKTLYLYKHSYPPQQVWVDASGMGQGSTGFADVYGEKNSTAQRNATFEGFEVDETEGSVLYGETGAKACLTGDEGVWSLWFSGSETPGFQNGCADVQLRGYDAPARVAREYTTE